MRRSSIPTLVCCGTLATALVAAPAHARPGSEPETIAEGLAGPLTLAVHDSSPRVYVTQSFAGRLTKIDRSGQTDLVVDDNPAGEVVGVSLGGGGVYYIQTDYEGWSSHVYRMGPRGDVTRVSDDLFAYEEMHNPDGGATYGFTGLSDSCEEELKAFEADNAGMLPPLSEYTGIIESHGYQTSVQGRDVYVADAAANAVLKVDGRTGSISTVAVLPATPTTFDAAAHATMEGMTGMEIPDCLVDSTVVPEPVPTDVEVGPDGMLYVSTLQGWMGEIAPLSSVYRVDPSSGATTWVAGGMHGATGLDLRGSDIVVAEMFGFQVSMIPSGSSSAQPLFWAHSPADVEVHGSTLYATTGTFDEENGGSVVRLRMR